jgi:dipeptidyl-peptidase-4
MTMRRTGLTLLFSLFLLVSSRACVQKEDASLLSLERIFSSQEFSAESLGPVRWSKDGSFYTTIEKSEDHEGGQDMVKHDPLSGQREILISSSLFIPEGESKPLLIEGFEWSEDGKRILIFTNSKRVWRQNTRGDYWVLDLGSWNLQKLGKDFEPSTLMFAKFSPDGYRAAYVCEKNIYVEDLKNHTITPLTKDGGETIINGTFDWVYEEEFSLRDGFRWSPDGRWIAYWQLDTEGLKDFYLVNNTDSLYPRVIPIKYPKVGQVNSSCRVGVVSAAGGETIWFDVPGDPRNHYIARMDWAENSEEIVFQYLNRLQNTNRVILGDIHSGKVQTIFTDTDEAWVEVVDDLHWLGKGRTFTWVSERDGWQHVYLISRSGENVSLATHGEYDVISVERIDEEEGWLYYMASPDNPTQRYLYRSRLDARGQPECLTPKELEGTHSYQISPDANWAFHTHSSFDTPPITELIRLPEHKSIRILIDNSTLQKKVKALKRVPVEFFRVDIGEEIQLDAWCMKPFDFDPAKRYPLLFYVYGEPAGSTVRDSWGGSRHLWHLLLTQHGYLVMSVDNRGTNVPRGRTWRKSIYRQIGILASKDQAKAVRAIIRSRRYVDPERIGIWGWSGGGSMSLNMIFRHPDLYHTAMAVAPVSNQLFYDTIYQERYMGLPEDNKEGYKEGSPITYANQLKGNLLIVHGTGDDNVHYQSTEALANALIAANKYFTMMAYPNRTHAIREGENTTRHLYELLTRYLEENLPAGARLP